MTPEQIRLVQTTWEMVVPIADQAAMLFYDRLFDLDPALRPLFGKSDMSEQRKKLMQMITVAVRGLDRFGELVPAVEALGRRHAGYHVRESDYDTVGAALLWTLEQGLGGAFTAPVREAWTITYTTLADAMKGAARAVAGVPALAPRGPGVYATA
jgi:hemoglobin-like flavoprotein